MSKLFEQVGKVGSIKIRQTAQSELFTEPLELLVKAERIEANM